MARRQFRDPTAPAGVLAHAPENGDDNCVCGGSFGGADDLAQHLALDGGWSQPADRDGRRLASASPSAISRLLGKAGFTRFESETTSVRGHARYYPGFSVRKVSEEDRLWSDERLRSAVIVEHETLSSVYDPTPDQANLSRDELRAQHLAKYEETLRAAGYVIVHAHERLHDVLLITGRNSPGHTPNETSP